MIRSSCLILLIIVCLLQLTAPTVHAIPANKSAVRRLTQPDGTTFEARLIGDEHAHWYETADGYTVARGSDGAWYYAVRDGDGRLVPSSTLAGVGLPPSSPHLRPQSRYIEASFNAVRAKQREVFTASAITGTADAVMILIEFSDTPASEGSLGPHTPAYFDDAATGLVLGANQGKLADYVDEVSYGQLTLQGVVANGAWHQTSQTEIYYGEDCSPGQACPPGADPAAETDNCNVCIYELARERHQSRPEVPNWVSASRSFGGHGVWSGEAPRLRY